MKKAIILCFILMFTYTICEAVVFSPAPAGDNLGDHKARQDLNISNFNIVNVSTIQGNISNFNQVIVSTIISTMQNITNIISSSGTFDTIIATTVKAGKFFGDGSSLIGVGNDNLGNHIATTTLNMNNWNIINASTITAGKYFGDGSGLTGIVGAGTTVHALLSGLDADDHKQYISTAAYRVNQTIESTGTITLKGDLFIDNAKNLVVTGRTEARSGLHTDNIFTIGDTLSSNFTSLNFGAGSSNNYSYGIGIGYRADSNYYGIGIGYEANSNYYYGIGIGYDANSNYNYGIGIGMRAKRNYNSGIGIGYGASYNSDYALGIGYFSQNNKPYSTSIGGYTYSASLSVSLGWNARSENIESVSLGAGAKTTADKSVSIGAYTINNETETIKLGYKTKVAGDLISDTTVQAVVGNFDTVITSTIVAKSPVSIIADGEVLRFGKIAGITQLQMPAGSKIEGAKRNYVYTILLREAEGTGSDTTTSSTWEDKLEVTGLWNCWIDSSTIISAKAYLYMRLASTSTASVVSGLTGVKVNSNWYYSPERSTATATSSTYQDYMEVIDIPASEFVNMTGAQLAVKMRTKSDTGQAVYYYLGRAYLVVKTEE